MINQTDYLNAVSRLKSEFYEFKDGKIYNEIVPEQQLVLLKYQPIFSQNGITKLTKEDYLSFLSFKNNCHWTGLERKGRNATHDMESLRDALTILLNDSISISERLPRATAIVTGMGKAIATSILLVAYPQKYGVWNGTSEKALKILQIFPSERLSDGLKYKATNDVFQRLSSDLEIDLWTLDALWWHFLKA